MKKFNKDVLYITIMVVLAFLLFRSCGDAEEKQLEISRLEHNVKVANDTLRQYVTENGNHAAEIMAYKLDIQKDAAIIEAMTEGYQDLKGSLVAVAKGRTEIIERREAVPVEVRVLSDTTGVITLADSTIYNPTNYSKLFVKAPYHLKGTILNVDKANYEVNTSLDLLLRFQEHNESLEVIAETPHKGVKFSSITGGVVQAQDLPKAVRMALRREWGLGFSLNGGLGYNPVTMSIGPMITLGVGVNYTPKKLQFK